MTLKEENFQHNGLLSDDENNQVLINTKTKYSLGQILEDLALSYL